MNRPIRGTRTFIHKPSWRDLAQAARPARPTSTHLTAGRVILWQALRRFRRLHNAKCRNSPGVLLLLRALFRTNAASRVGAGRGAVLAPGDGPRDPPQGIAPGDGPRDPPQGSRNQRS